MIEERDIETLAHYLVRTRGQEARDFVVGRMAGSEQAAEWRRVAAAMDRLDEPKRHVASVTSPWGAIP
jgi:hypothetical protein